MVVCLSRTALGLVVVVTAALRPGLQGNRKGTARGTQGFAWWGVSSLPSFLPLGCWVWDGKGTAREPQGFPWWPCPVLQVVHALVEFLNYRFRLTRGGGQAEVTPPPSSQISACAGPCRGVAGE